MNQLAGALSPLPPQPAGRAEVAIYLAALARWLNSDPWPQDTRYGGPSLTPAVIERQLVIRSGRGKGEVNLDADGLAAQCSRLVVLGGPGAGKTWLARRADRPGFVGFSLVAAVVSACLAGSDSRLL